MTNMHKFAFFMVGSFYAIFAIAQVDSEKKGKSEDPVMVDLPASSQNFKSFYNSERFDFAVALDSISILPGEDPEIHYTLKATSKQGATNVTYEGIRCDIRQKIIYAVEHNDGSWARARSPEWSAISNTGLNIPQFRLAHDYFCAGRSLAGSVERIRDNIQWNRPTVN